MKNQIFLRWFILLLTILITLKHSQAKHAHPISEISRIFDQIPNPIRKWWIYRKKFQEAELKLTGPVVMSGLLSFLAASISSAGGIGGGGLFIPILSIVANLDLKTASSLSAFMVSGGSFANVMCQLFMKNSKYGGRTLIDYDIALLSEPCMLLGVSAGVICNIMFPEWLITALFAVFLACCTFKTCYSGLLFWKMESEKGRGNGVGKSENGDFRGREGVKSFEEPLLRRKMENCDLGIPWMKLGALAVVWFSFLLLYLLRGDRYGQSLVPMEPCGVVYWILAALQIPLAILFTAWILCKRESHDRASYLQEQEDQIIGSRPSNKLIFPGMALLAGALGGVFGIGGGMLISPLLLQVGISPEVTAATCSFMVFFSSTMSAIQFLLLGMEHVLGALIFAFICFVASILGLVVVQRSIERHGRASLIVFSVGIVMGLSTVLMTSFGAFDVWRDYSSGKYMGFKLPC
ncbi:hypothetical protein NMG60_11009747 [Bertholletia excelsa]